MFMFFKKATKTDEIFTVNLTLGSKCQMYSENFVNFRGLLKKHELYNFFAKRAIVELLPTKCFSLKMDPNLKKLSVFIFHFFDL